MCTVVTEMSSNGSIGYGQLRLQATGYGLRVHGVTLGGSGGLRHNTEPARGLASER